jgi:hypothetical protein
MASKADHQGADNSSIDASPGYVFDPELRMKSVYEAFAQHRGTMAKVLLETAAAISDKPEDCSSS